MPHRLAAQACYVLSKGSQWFWLTEKANQPLSVPKQLPTKTHMSTGRTCSREVVDGKCCTLKPLETIVCCICKVIIPGAKMDFVHSQYRCPPMLRTRSMEPKSSGPFSSWRQKPGACARVLAGSKSVAVGRRKFGAWRYQPKLAHDHGPWENTQFVQTSPVAGFPSPLASGSKGLELINESRLLRCPLGTSATPEHF